MKMEDETLRNLYQGYLASRTPKNRKSCPSSIEINSFFDYSVSRRRKKKLIDHISRCSYCAKEFGLLLDLYRYNLPFAQIRETLFSKIYEKNNAIIVKSNKPFLLRLSSVLLGFTLIIFALHFMELKHALWNAQRARSTTILLFYPLKVHSLSGPIRFRWHDQPHAQYYVIEIFDEALLPVWTSPKIFSSHFLLPETIMTRLSIGNTYFWMVTSFSELDKLNESDLASFMILNK